MRIVSFVPAATEMVCALGLDDQLVGRSHECDFPASITDRPAVTHAHLSDQSPSGVIDAEVRERAAAGQPLYGIDAATLKALKPDLLLTQDLCDVCAIAPAQVEAALDPSAPRPRIMRLAPGGVDDVLQDLLRLGEMTQRTQAAADCVERLRQRLDAATAATATPSPAPRVLFLEWLDPPFSAGHWNPELIRRAGAQSVLPVADGQRSGVIASETLEQLVTDLIFVAACGFGAPRARREWDALPPEHPLRALHTRTGARLVFADGNAHFNRPGPRLVDSMEYLRDAVRATSAGAET